MSLFTIADLHLSFGTDKPMDIFTGWQDYVSKIEENWRSLVCDEDTVVIPGDISWSMDFAGLKKDFEFLQNLPGKKLLLKGNHDYWWSTMSKMNRMIEENGFDTLSIIHNNAVAAQGYAICGTRGWFYDGGPGEDKKVLLREVGRLTTSVQAAIKTGLEPIVFLHFPPVYGSYVCEEILEVLTKNGIRRCYYGHLHGRAAQNAVEGEYRGVIFRLVSCDYLRFSPVRIG